MYSGLDLSRMVSESDPRWSSLRYIRKPPLSLGISRLIHYALQFTHSSAVQSYCWKAAAHSGLPFSSLSSHVRIIVRLILTKRVEAVCSRTGQSFEEVAVSSLFSFLQAWCRWLRNPRGWWSLGPESPHEVKLTTSQEHPHHPDTYKQTRNKLPLYLSHYTFWGLYVTAASIRLIRTSQEQLIESEERWIRSCFINYNVQNNTFTALNIQQILMEQLRDTKHVLGSK